MNALRVAALAFATVWDAAMAGDALARRSLGGALVWSALGALTLASLVAGP